MRKPINIWNVDINHILLLESVEIKKRFKCMIGYLHDVTRPLILLISEVSIYVTDFDENKLMSFRTDDDKVWEKSQNIWNKIEVLKVVRLAVFSVHNGKYIKNNIRTCGKK